MGQVIEQPAPYIPGVKALQPIVEQALQGLGQCRVLADIPRTRQTSIGRIRRRKMGVCQQFALFFSQQGGLAQAQGISVLAYQMASSSTASNGRAGWSAALRASAACQPETVPAMVLAAHPPRHGTLVCPAAA